jgi:Protein of unknown function (DUF2804)
VLPTSLPYRGVFGDPRPGSLVGVPLPPGPVPSHHGTRPLKAWRYIGVYAADIMLCLTQARVGRVRQTSWAVWDREKQRLYERTRLGRGGLCLRVGGASLVERSVELELELELEETSGVETVCRCGESYGWTRKQGGVPAHGTIVLAGSERQVDGRAIVDDTAAFYPRLTDWRWCAGVGRSVEGRALAWNLVQGVNDPAANSERTVWVEEEPREVPPSSFASDLHRVDDLDFVPEASVERRQNLLLLSSDYRQPFGTFSGVLPDGSVLAEGYGVMEEHRARW